MVWSNNKLTQSLSFVIRPSVHVLNLSRYHLLCSLHGAGLERLLVHGLSEARHGSVLAALQPQAKVFDLRQVSLAHRLVLLAWWDRKKCDICYQSAESTNSG